MRNLSRLVFLAAMTVTVVMVGCNKDKDDDAPATSIVKNNISVTVPDVDPQVENVKLLVDCTIHLNWVVDEQTGEGKFTTNVTGQEIARGSFSGGKLTMNLPETVANEYLVSIYENAEVPAGISVSNSSAKGIGGFLVGYDRDENTLGWFFYGKYDRKKEEFLMAALTYVDNDVLITGKTSIYDEYIKATAIFDCNFMKGWNFMYVIFSGDDEVDLVTKTTTTNPGGLVWLFEKF